MTKLVLINIVGTVALAAVLSAAQMSPTLAATKPLGGDMVPSEGTARVMQVAYQIEQRAPDFFDSFLDLSPTDRDHLLFRLADERSMRLLAITNAAKPTGPMDAR